MDRAEENPLGVRSYLGLREPSCFRVIRDFLGFTDRLKPVG